MAALFVLVAIQKRNDKLSGNVQMLKYQKAEKAAKKRLKASKLALDSNNLSGFYSELSSALYGYLEDKFNIQKSEFTLETALEKLKLRNVDDTLIERVRTSAEKCEFVRFAPQGETSATANEIYEETVKVIIEVDSSLEKKR
jgi:hypothetical protein